MSKELNIRKEIVKETDKTDHAWKTRRSCRHIIQSNKITEKTYDKLSVEAFSLISQNISEKEKICSAFFHHLNNSFFCHLIKLYKGFIEINDDFSTFSKNKQQTM